MDLLHSISTLSPSQTFACDMNRKIEINGHQMKSFYPVIVDKMGKFQIFLSQNVIEANEAEVIKNEFNFYSLVIC